jgi:hypothetical protein
VTAALITITGPIASGKNSVATSLADLLGREDHTVVIADLDDVAAMVAGAGAAASGLWFAAHEAHGALVAQWVLSDVDLVVSVGPVYSEAEQHALYGGLPPGTKTLRVLLDAAPTVTWERVHAAATRGRSRDHDFHMEAHARFQSLKPGIPADLIFNSGHTTAGDIAIALSKAVKLGRGRPSASHGPPEHSSS